MTIICCHRRAQPGNNQVQNRPIPTPSTLDQIHREASRLHLDTSNRVLENRMAQNGLAKAVFSYIEDTMKSVASSTVGACMEGVVTFKNKVTGNTNHESLKRIVNFYFNQIPERNSDYLSLFKINNRVCGNGNKVLATLYRNNVLTAQEFIHARSSWSDRRIRNQGYQGALSRSGGPDNTARGFMNWAHEYGLTIIVDKSETMPSLDAVLEREIPLT